MSRLRATARAGWKVLGEVWQGFKAPHVADWVVAASLVALWIACIGWLRL